MDKECACLQSGLSADALCCRQRRRARERTGKLSGAEAMIEHLQVVMAKMKRAKFGPRAERRQRLLDQLELQVEEFAAAAGEDVAKAAAERFQVQGFTRRKAMRRNFPEGLPRRRIVHLAPTSCSCCGGSKLSKIGEDVTKHSISFRGIGSSPSMCARRSAADHARQSRNRRPPSMRLRECFVGPSLLAMMLVEKYPNHQRSTGRASNMRARGSSSPYRPWPIMSAPARLP
jgi:hypothetical protein